MTQTINPLTRDKWFFVPSWPPVVWIIATTLVLGFAHGLGAPELIGLFNDGWGRSLGEFSLILLPSFVLASALTQKNIGAASGVAVAASPFAGAGMVCPDTAYAALSPMAGRQSLSVAFGSYAGFKLLFPAGPLIVATGLGVQSSSLLVTGLALLIPVWAIGVWWANYFDDTEFLAPTASVSAENRTKLILTFLPFAALTLLLIIGELADFSTVPLLDFLTGPKGALMFAATWALCTVSGNQRRKCIDDAVRRTGSLLLLIGAASAFAGVFTIAVPIADFFTSEAGMLGIISLFLLTAVFKLAQGSSMATFAAVAPVAAPLVAASSISPVAAVFAICLGSFVAILPNDSFYWLVRQDALAISTEPKTVALLAGGATLQAFSGLFILLALNFLGFVE